MTIREVEGWRGFKHMSHLIEAFLIRIQQFLDQHYVRKIKLFCV